MHAVLIACLSPKAVDNFYGKTIGQNFSKRKLTIHDVEVQQLGDIAIVLFDWDFDATRQEDAAEIRTKVRESQIYLRRDGEWALTHVHYSGERRTAPMEGF